MPDDHDTHPAAPVQHRPHPPEPCAMVLFGAGGDLTHRLVFPALYNLSRTGLLPANFALIGVDLADHTTDDWVKTTTDGLRKLAHTPGGEFQADVIDEAALGWLADRMSYLRGDLNNAETYKQIDAALKDSDSKHKTGQSALFYLAVADRFFGPVVDHLGAAGLVTQPEEHEGKRAFWRRVVIEKPFGHDLPSARALNTRVLKVLDEDQVFRIDHFLGKETVQNIMAMRFANGMFEPIWNRDRIDHVQITAAETVGVEQRGKFYEQTGALRDMVPNHVFQLLAMTAMEPPTSFSADAIRARKTDVLQAIRQPKPEDAVRGQYGAGSVLGRPARAYRDEPDVAQDSPIETYVALRLEIENWRWAGVPFYLRTGKNMTARSTEIAIRFKQAPYALFEDTPVDSLPPNWLVIRVQPDEGISLQFEVKRPGPRMELAPVKMDFRYKDWFTKEPNVGYETLLYDVMIGDATLFQRADQVDAGWSAVQPVLDHWAATVPKDFPNYESGSAGPAAADALIARDGGRSWRPVDPNGHT
jgi:glucose-6-phosphate 1-dehydrogenase